MDTNINISGELGDNIDFADDCTAKNILELLEVKQSSLWFGDAAGDVSDVVDLFANDQKTLTFDEVKQLYPDWFKE
jgi:hypothetical protein